MSTLIDVATVAALALVLAGLAWGYYNEWRTGDAAKRREMAQTAIDILTDEKHSKKIRETVLRLVEAAEQTYREPKSGSLRFSVVMRRLKETYPDLSHTDIETLIGQAVYRMKLRQTHSHHRNGATDHHAG